MDWYEESFIKGCKFLLIILKKTSLGVLRSCRSLSRIYTPARVLMQITTYFEDLI